jgi:hypothetical protein
MPLILASFFYGYDLVFCRNLTSLSRFRPMALRASFAGNNLKKPDDMKHILSIIWKRHKPTKPQAAAHLER